MTAADTDAMTALRALLDERQRYEGWIAALDARRDAAATHVYERVRGDYLVRLDSVVQRLAERSEQLRATIDTLSARREELLRHEGERSEARQEAELRAVVGEYSQAEWDKLRDDADLEIAVLQEERTAVERELAELQSIMQLTAAAPAATPEPPAPAPVESVVEETAAPIAATPAPAPAADSDAPSIDDFVADWPLTHVDAPANATAAPAPTPKPAASATPSPFAPPLAAASPPPPPAASRATPMFTPPRPEPAVPATASLAPDPDVRREQEKTLKCPECGAYNYATEWYCERCGGELATY